MAPVRSIPCVTLTAITVLFLGGAARAQSFDSTSTGADGSLTFPADAGVVVFDPAVTENDAGAVLGSRAGNVFHFVEVTIPSGTTVELRADALGGDGRAVTWLATGDIVIDGILDLDGEAGHSTTDIPVASIAGAGGFGGGASGAARQRGNGPGSGGFSGAFGLGGSHRTQGHASGGGTLYGNRFLLPLAGGSGGGAGDESSDAGGGGGGGAILLASSTEIQVGGTIRARGGDSGSGTSTHGGPGSGGAIRLVAPVVSGAGDIDVSGGIYAGYVLFAGSGWIRVQAFEHGLRDGGTFTPEQAATFATPGTLFLPATAPKVRISTVDGVAAPASPTGSFETVDVTIDDAGEVTIELEAENVPIGTTAQLVLLPEDGTSTVVTSSGFSGLLEASTATATATFAAGFTRVSVSATWTP